MKTSGIQLQHAITARKELRELLQGEFNGSLSKFKDEEKRDPTVIADDLEIAEQEIAALQAAQGLYNTKVMVTVNGELISLLQAVKAVGGANRLANLWKEVAGINAHSLHHRRRYDPYAGQQVREEGQEYAKETVTSREAGEKARAASKKARAVQAAISFGNAQEIDIDINPELLSS